MLACSAAKSSTVPSHSPKKALFQFPSKDPGYASQGTAGLQRLPKFQVQISRDQAIHVAGLKMGKLRSDLLASWSFPKFRCSGRWLMAHGGHLRPPKFWEIANCHLDTFPTNTNKKPCIGDNGVKTTLRARRVVFRERNRIVNDLGQQKPSKSKVASGQIAKCLEAMASSQAVPHPHMATVARGFYVAHEPTPTTHGHGL